MREMPLSRESGNIPWVPWERLAGGDYGHAVCPLYAEGQSEAD